MSSPCYGCDHIGIDRVGWSMNSPVVPFCMGYEVVLKKDANDDPVPCNECDFKTPEDDHRETGV